MPQELHIFAAVWGFVDERLAAVLGDRVAGVTAEVAGPLRLALVLYVVLYGLAIMRGAIAEPVTDFGVRTIKLVMIYAIAVTPAYGDYVTEPLFDAMPEVLARAVSGGAADTVGDTFDELINMSGYLGDRAAQDGALTDIIPWIVAGIVYVVGPLAAALGFGVVLLAKVALALIVTLGPIFVALALFEATRRFFFGWLSQAVNYLVLFALTLAVAQLVLDLIRDQWDTLESADPIVGGLAFTALCILAGFFFLQLPWLASGIASGASLGLPSFNQSADRRSESVGRRDGSRSNATTSASNSKTEATK